MDPALPRCRFLMKRDVFNLCYMTPSTATVTVQAATTAILKIMGYLDGKSRTECRLVCRAWKKVLDEEIGLWFILNEKKFKHENGFFCRSVLLERLTVAHVNKFKTLVAIKYPDRLKILRCIGPVDSDWFKSQILLKCRNLVRIELSGRFLQSQELAKQSPSPPVPHLGQSSCKGTSSSDSDGSRSGKISHHVTFNHLKSLIISYTDHDYQAYQLKVNGAGPLQAIWGTILGGRFEAIYLLKQVIDSNVTFLLDTIRSSSLRTLYVSVDGMLWDENKSHPAWSYRWKRLPLKHFLEAHRLTLRRLYLPHYGGDSKKEDRTFPIFPCNLRTLEISLLQKGDRKNTRFMEKLLLIQTELQELRLDKHYVGHSLIMFPCLVSVIHANRLTLTFVHLNLTQHDQEFMDGAIFGECRLLQTLIIQRTHERVIFRHVTNLPKSLRCLRIHVTVWFGETEMFRYKHFKKLETLVLDDILLEARGTHRTHQVLRLVRNVLRMRRLDRFHLDTQEPDPDGPCLPLNGIIQTLYGGHDVSQAPTKGFSMLQMYPNTGGLLEEEESRHFLDSDPLYRTNIDPNRRHGPDFNGSASAQDVVVKSNMFDPNEVARIQERNDEDSEEEAEKPWCEFCYGLLNFT